MLRIGTGRGRPPQRALRDRPGGPGGRRGLWAATVVRPPCPLKEVVRCVSDSAGLRRSGLQAYAFIALKAQAQGEAGSAARESRPLVDQRVGDSRREGRDGGALRDRAMSGRREDRRPLPWIRRRRNSRPGPTGSLRLPTSGQGSGGPRRAGRGRSPGNIAGLCWHRSDRRPALTPR